jgi:hypothetical protein
MAPTQLGPTEGANLDHWMDGRWKKPKNPAILCYTPSSEHFRINHDPSVRASEDVSCLRPRDHCDRQNYGLLPRLSHYHFVKIPFQFIIRQSPIVQLKKNRGFSQQTISTERATAAFQRS